METTPSANRLHIGIFGRCNSGKSSLLNALAEQQTALVSETPGTTTDPVVKSISTTTANWARSASHKPGVPPSGATWP